jgi:nucleoside-diphosphate-sugar epimerase
MKIVVIGGTGLIGSKVVTCLKVKDHEAVAASLDSGVNTLTGDGLAEVLAALVEAEHSFDLGQGLSQAAHGDPQRVLAGVDPQD